MKIKFKDDTIIDIKDYSFPVMLEGGKYAGIQGTLKIKLESGKSIILEPFGGLHFESYNPTNTLIYLLKSDLNECVNLSIFEFIEQMKQDLNLNINTIVRN